MGVRLRTTLTATAAVAVALCLASIALFVALDSSLAHSTEVVALQDAKARAAAEGIVAVEVMPPGVRFKDNVMPPGATPPPIGPGASAGGGKGTATDTGSGAGTGSGSGSGKDSATNSTTGSGTAGVTGEPGLAHSFFSAKGGETKLVVTQTISTKNGPVTIEGSASLAPARAAMRTLTHVLIPGVPALLALVALFSWLAVGRALRPVSAIRAKVAEITAHGLHERVPEPNTRDEIAALARTVNATLDRLRTAVDAHRQFVADAAHELRSPMAILRTRLELARPAEKALAVEALDDVARLQSLTSDLLLLARLDARQPLRVRELDLAQLVAEEAARKRPRLEIRVILDLTPDLLVLGSHDHLRRLVANLVDNAVRHAATTVRVTLGRRDGHAVLDLTDDGDGIPAEHRTTVFDRFTRLDAARPRDTGGSGLGLPIARDIATAHGATLMIIPPPTPPKPDSPHPNECTPPPPTGAHLRAVFPLRAERGAERHAQHKALLSEGATL